MPRRSSCEPPDSRPFPKFVFYVEEGLNALVRNQSAIIAENYNRNYALCVLCESIYSRADVIFFLFLFIDNKEFVSFVVSSEEASLFYFFIITINPSNNVTFLLHSSFLQLTLFQFMICEKSCDQVISLSTVTRNRGVDVLRENTRNDASLFFFVRGKPKSKVLGRVCI